MVRSQSHHPSKAQWDEKKQAIYKLYLIDNQTCGEVERYLRQHGFVVSQRQIKNRLNEWGFERKKTPSSHYVAMLSVATHSSDQGGDMVFRVPKRHGYQTLSMPRVKKECDRIKKNLDNNGGCFQLLPPDEAATTLHDAGIFYGLDEESAKEAECATVDRQQPSHSPLQFAPGFHGGARSAWREQSRHSPATSERSWRFDASSPGKSPFLSDSLATSPSMLGSPSASQTPGSVESPKSSLTTMTPSPSPTTDQLISAEFRKLHTTPHARLGQSFVIDAGQSAEYHGSGLLPTCQPNAHRLKLEQAASSGNPGEWGVHRQSSNHDGNVAQSSFPGAETNFTLLEYENFALDAAMWASSSNILFGNGPFNPGDVEMKAAMTWTAPYSKSFTMNARPDEIKCRRLRAQAALQDSLEKNNPYIFPCLAYMALALGHEVQRTTLIEFLQDSCDVIDENSRWRDSFTIAAPFHYTLACIMGKTDLMDHYGAGLHRSLEQIRAIWGEESSNYLVCAHFLAWHWLWQGKCDESIKLLESCLQTSESQLGYHNLITINCMVILSRALTQKDDLYLAVRFLQCAVERLDAERDDIEPYRCVLLYRLAQLKGRAVGDSRAVEHDLWESLRGRARTTGIGNAATWSAGRGLEALFERSGRHEEAHQLIVYMRKRMEWEHLRECSIKEGTNPPETNWWPYPELPELPTHLTTYTQREFFRFS